MKKELKEKALFNRLNGYFKKRYGEYEMTANHYPDDTDNCWTFDIEESGVTVRLICDKYTGKVSERLIDKY